MAAGKQRGRGGVTINRVTHRQGLIDSGGGGISKLRGSPGRCPVNDTV